MLRDQLPCLGCHRLGQDGGSIGPDLTTVRARRSPEYIAEMIADPQRVAPGSVMPRTVMPPKVEILLTRYLATRPGAAPVPGAVASRASTVPIDRSAAALYARFCAACHGVAGKGDGPNARSLPVRPAVHASREAMSKRPDDSLFDTIAGGGAIMNRSARMPAYGATLTPDEVRGLVRHIRTLCRCEGPGWATDGTRR